MRLDYDMKRGDEDAEARMDEIRSDGDNSCESGSFRARPSKGEKMLRTASVAEPQKDN